MTDTPATPKHCAPEGITREAAGLIATALLDGKPAPWTSWVAVEAIEVVGALARVVVIRGSSLRLAAFSLSAGGESFTCTDEIYGSEPIDTNEARTKARREAILDLWAAARLRAQGWKPMQRESYDNRIVPNPTR
jgi:hypothetical protein